MASSVQVAFTTVAPGPFTLPHNLGVVPGSVIFEFTSGGIVWFQSPPAVRYDASNLYLVASDAGVSGYAIIFASSTPACTMQQSNSTIRLQELVDDAATFGDVAPVLATGGQSMAPALSIANDVMQALINGGPGGQPYNWKWNRINLPPLITNSLQQDYFIPGLVNLAWLEMGWAVNINQTSIPKQTIPVECHKDLQPTYYQNTYPGKASWSPNKLLESGTWGAAPLGPTEGNPSGQTTVAGPNQSGQQNPGPGVIYVNPLGTLITPQNATTCITDPYGNLWCLTTYGTCGMTEPVWPTNPTFPTFRNPNILPTTVVDGTCVWTAINPNGQGIRLTPMPPIAGIVWSVQLVGQARAPRFFNLSQYLNPVPDDWEWAIKQGFFCECFRRSNDPKVRAKYPQEKQNWLEALDKAVKQADREWDDYGFYPSQMILDTGWGLNPINPALPLIYWGLVVIILLRKSTLIDLNAEMPTRAKSKRHAERLNEWTLYKQVMR
jgi:hypothetical protein